MALRALLSSLSKDIASIQLLLLGWFLAQSAQHKKAIQRYKCSSMANASIFGFGLLTRRNLTDEFNACMIRLSFILHGKAGYNVEGKGRDHSRLYAWQLVDTLPWTYLASGDQSWVPLAILSHHPPVSLRAQSQWQAELLVEQMLLLLLSYQALPLQWHSAWENRKTSALLSSATPLFQERAKGRKIGRITQQETAREQRHRKAWEHCRHDIQVHCWRAYLFWVCSPVPLLSRVM